MPVIEVYVQALVKAMILNIDVKDKALHRVLM